MLGILRLELKMLVSHHVVLKSNPGPLEEHPLLSLLSHLSSPISCFLQQMVINAETYNRTVKDFGALRSEWGVFIKP